jgi:hypothetical protein
VPAAPRTAVIVGTGGPSAHVPLAELALAAGASETLELVAAIHRTGFSGSPVRR